MEEKEVEFKQVSEREIYVGKNRFYHGEDNIIYATIVGETDDKVAIGILEANLKLLSMVEGKAKILVDLNKAGKTSPEARKIMKQLAEQEKIGKLALFGMHPVAKVLASFAMGITRKKDMLFFKTKAEALLWFTE